MTVAATTTESKPRATPAGVAAFLVLGAIVLLFWADIATLLQTWGRSATYSHGYLVALVVPWLIYRERQYLRAESDAPTALALLGLLVLMVLWSLAFAARVDLVREALLPVVALATILAVLGRDAARRLLFPLAWFWCAVPLFDFLPPYLQRVTAIIVQGGVGAVGIPILREGNFLTVPEGAFEVAAGCSGLNFLLVSLTVSTLYGYLHAWPLKARLRLVGLALGVALLANWLRVFVIVVAGQLTHMQTSLVRDGHYVFGWWLFAGGLVLFFLLAGRFEAKEVPRSSSPPATAGAAPVGRRMLLVLVLVGSVTGLAYGREYRAVRAAAAAPAPILLPAGERGWSGPRVVEFAWRPQFAGATVEARGAYDGAAGTVYTDVAYYAVERKGAKLIGYPSDPNGDGATTLLSATSRTLAGGLPVRVLHVRVGSGEEWQVLQWYQVDGVPVASGPAFKWREALRAFTGGTAVVAVSLASPCERGCAADPTLLVDFANQMQDRLRVRASAAGGPS